MLMLSSSSLLVSMFRHFVSLVLFKPLLSVFFLQKLKELEKEEELREKTGMYDSDMSDEDDEMIMKRQLARRFVSLIFFSTWLVVHYTC